ncbi:MAG: hypothetical protein WBD87_11315, partial [Candidatus Acidiferrales bacterium]
APAAPHSSSIPTSSLTDAADFPSAAEKKTCHSEPGPLPVANGVRNLPCIFFPAFRSIDANATL